MDLQRVVLDYALLKGEGMIKKSLPPGHTNNGQSVSKNYFFLDNHGVQGYQISKTKVNFQKVYLSEGYFPKMNFSNVYF